MHCFVAKNGNNVEATFDFVERTKFYDKLVRHCCRFWKKMLLRQGRTLIRHCCWCGRSYIENRVWKRVILTGAAEQADGKPTNDSSVFRSLHHPERTEATRFIIAIAVTFYNLVRTPPHSVKPA